MSRISSRSWVSAARRCTSSRTAERVRRRAAASRSAVRTASESDKLPARTISSASAEASSRRTCSDRATAPSVARIVLQISTHTFHTVAPRGLVHGPKRVSGGPSRRPHGGTAGLFRLQEQPTPRNRRPELPSPVGERAFILWTGWRDVLVVSPAHGPGRESAQEADLVRLRVRFSDQACRMTTSWGHWFEPSSAHVRNARPVRPRVRPSDRVARTANVCVLAPAAGRKQTTAISSSSFVQFVVDSSPEPASRRWCCPSGSAVSSATHWSNFSAYGKGDVRSSAAASSPSSSDGRGRAGGWSRRTLGGGTVCSGSSPVFCSSVSRRLPVGSPNARTPR